VDLGALGKNLEVARRESGAEIMAVVKAGAYGHGLVEVATYLERHQVAFLGVANVGEARRIRDSGVQSRLYLLGATWSAEREEVVAREFTPCISSIAEAEEFNAHAERYGKILRVHLAVDTGMGRGGFVMQDLAGAIPHLRGFRNLAIEGIGSHLPSADEDEAFTRAQIASYERVLADLGGGEQFRYRHLMNSAGLLGYANSLCNLARPGLMLYGISPLPDHQAKLSNVMSLKSRVALIRELPTGHGVSYGREFVTKRPTRVATVGIGYGDGYPRSVSGKGAEVAIRHRRFPIIGRVTMDQIMVDVTDDRSIREGDEVEVFGAMVPVAELARKAGTIPWEILTGITPRVCRQYLG
jgi:alanine racemase